MFQEGNSERLPRELPHKETHAVVPVKLSHPGDILTLGQKGNSFLGSSLKVFKDSNISFVTNGS